ncbi:MAG: hypothetical protein NTV06_02185 [candidate division Zixibacteria bacterium]|nr:hypothetical protein [candidate division Zixibacteria bacterium]
MAGVLAVLFILLTIFFAVFTFAISRTAILQKNINRTRAAYLAKAGINQFLYIINRDTPDWKEIGNYELTKEISAHEKYSIQVSLLGGYILINSTGIADGKKLTQKALIGLMPWKELNAAIINGEMNFPVVVTGQTEIIGDAIVGPQSVIAGSMEGEAYQGKELIKGNIFPRSKEILPVINKQIIESYLNGLTNKRQNPTRFIPGSLVLSEIKIDRNQDELILSVEDNIEIKSIRLKARLKHITILAGGNIIINGSSDIDGLIELVAGNSIIIADNSSLCGTIVIAEDSIVFQDQSLFMGQAISGSIIKVRNNAKILYPSLLYTKARESDTAGGIEFSTKSKSSTIAIAEGSGQKESASSNMIKIDTNVVVDGIIFSEQYTELMGTLYGTSITKSYWHYKPPTTYINWLKNVTIDHNKLDFLPILPIMLPARNGYAIFNVYEDNL